MKIAILILVAVSSILILSIFYIINHADDFGENLKRCAKIGYDIKYNAYTGYIENFCYEYSDIIIFSEYYPQ